MLIVTKTSNESERDKEHEHLPDCDAPTTDEALAEEGVVEHCLGHTVVRNPVFVADTSPSINRLGNFRAFPQLCDCQDVVE